MARRVSDGNTDGGCVSFGATAEYAWANIMIAVFIMVRDHLYDANSSHHPLPQIINIPFEFPFLFRSLLHAQNYLWCRANPTMKISLFGLLSIPVPCECQVGTSDRRTS